MPNPYNERFLKAVAYLLDRGMAESQNKLCQAIDLLPTHMTGIRSGQRNISLTTVTNLHTIFGVSITYMVLGRPPIMEKEREPDPQPDDVTDTPPPAPDLVKELALTQSIVDLQQRILAEKDAEIAFLRNLLLNKDEKK